MGKLNARLSAMSMIIADFFNSYAGMYVAQSFCHSIIASIITDQALRAWNVGDPGVRQRFRLIVVLVPIFSFPLYQAFNQNRSSVLFRLESLFDVNRWLNMEIWGVIPVGLLVLVMMGITSLIFVFQEMVPVILHALQAKNIEQEGRRWEPDPFVESASRALSIAVPDIFIIDDDEFVIFSTTSRNPVIFLSEGLVAALTPEQMQAAIAHELAHIARSRRPVLLTTFVLRVIMFFNPISLVEFRRAVRNEEKICDDVAVALTKRGPEDLIETLKKFFPAPRTEPESGRKPLFTPVPLEEYSHRMQLESRIARLAAAGPQSRGGRWLLFTVTVLVIAGINYFVV